MLFKLPDRRNQAPDLERSDDTSSSYWSCNTRFGRGRGLCADHFCSGRCRDWFDAGSPRYAGSDPGYLSKTDGVTIVCAGCKQLFASKGLRCCSPACENRLRERAAKLATLAKAGIKPAERKKCEQCGAGIPRFRGTGKARRAVRQDVRFCSPACAKKGFPGIHSQIPVFGTIEVKKCL